MNHHKETKPPSSFAFVQVALEASTVPPEGASESELKQHRLAKIVDGLIDRKVQRLPYAAMFCAVPCRVGLGRARQRDARACLSLFAGSGVRAAS